MKKTKTKLAANLAQKLFPLTEDQVKSFVDRCRVNNCPNAHHNLGTCAGEVHEIQKQYNVKVNDQGDWQYKQGTQESVEELAFCIDHENIPSVIGEVAVLTDEDSIMKRLLGNQECPELNDQQECSHISE